jgi:hypothetical protein
MSSASACSGLPLLAADIFIPESLISRLSGLVRSSGTST